MDQVAVQGWETDIKAFNYLNWKLKVLYNQFYNAVIHDKCIMQSES